ncbi:MAG: Na+/H+ antiporter NhaA [Pseudorhodoplanes sp.]|nr:Na(+)/H(+) antiporter NhaA [Pseudorhodoplanes sp.]MCL4712686.1 Na+/H+ antiporter NhaA [Pseudorhodoplanes sp.]
MALTAVRRRMSVLRNLWKSESAGGLALMGTAALALVVANSPFAATYFALLQVKAGPLSLQHWINDGLMAVFFLFVGLEIKRELADGELSSWRRRILPGIAAAGGMIVPALIFVAFTVSSPGLVRGWAIPTATDIAFAIAVLALLRSAVPVSLAIFLTAVAVIDDLAAVIVIALFYTAELQALWIAAAALVVGALAVLNRFGIERLAVYLAAGFALWFCVLQSGVHATLAGVALAFTIPLRPSPGRPEDPHSPLHRLEHALNPYVAFLVVPLFGFANAGVSFSGSGVSALFHPLTLACAAGLFFGKQIGVFGSVWLAVRFGLAARPLGARWPQIFGVAILCGIGFTMSLFIGLLAFPADPALMDAVKIGVLAGSLASSTLGVIVLLMARRRRPDERAQRRAAG